MMTMLFGVAVLTLGSSLIIPTAMGQITANPDTVGPAVVDQTGVDSALVDDTTTGATAADHTDGGASTPPVADLTPAPDTSGPFAADDSQPPQPDLQQAPSQEVGIVPAATSCAKPPPLTATKDAQDETGLRQLISKVSPSGKLGIRITNDIHLTQPLEIPANTTITLESVDASLYGPKDAATIIVKGTLTVNGLNIYHGDLVNSTSVAIHVAETGAAYVYAGIITREPGQEIPDNFTPTAGAVHVVGGEFYLRTKGWITGNAASDGAAILVESSGSDRGSASIANCAQVSHNTVYGPGKNGPADARGVISVRQADFSLADGGSVNTNTFHNMSDTPVDASTVAAFDATADIRGTISNNTMTAGGAIYGYHGTILLDKARLIGNAATNGGALYATEHTEVRVRSSNTRISDNTATGNSGHGGGLDILNSTLTMERGSIFGNTAANGGGVAVDPYATFTLQGGTIGVGPGADPKARGNSAIYGAGVFVDTGAKFAMSGDSLILGNRQADDTKKDTKGGGVYAYWAASVTIEGGRVSGNSAQRGGDVYAHRTPVTITGGMIESGTAVSGGGVFLLDKSTLTLSDATIGDTNLADEVSEGCTARQGGGVWAADSTIELKDGARISGNVATAEDSDPPRLGAGVYLQGASKLTMTGGAITGNTTPGAGGGVYVDADSEFIHNAGTIGVGFGAPADAKGNSARVGAGVHLAPKSRYAMSGSATIAGNQDPDYASSGTRGGGVYADKATSFTMEGGRISNNSARNGGNIDASATPVTIRGAMIDSGQALLGGCVFLDNKAELTLSDAVIGDSDPSDDEALGCRSLHGGGIFQASSTVDLKGKTKIIGNAASGIGGGVFTYGGKVSTMDQASITDNTANEAGGVYAAATSGVQPSLDLAGAGAIDHNTAKSGGGGILLADGSVDLGVALTNNTSSTSGGGLYMVRGATAIVRSAVTGNTAQRDGGGIWAPWDQLDKLTVESSATFADNKATTATGRDPYFDKVYADTIHATQWSSGATQGYNNLDIGYSTPPTHTVTFLDFDDTVLATQEVYPGADATAPTPPDKPGMTFTGWTESFTSVQADITTRATYDYIPYTITYDVANGTPPIADNPATYTVKDLPLTLPEKPTKPGHTFAGWASAPDSPAMTTVPKGTFGHLTLRAVWTRNPSTAEPNPSPTPGGPTPTPGSTDQPPSPQCQTPPALDPAASLAGDETTLRGLIPQETGSKKTIRLTEDIQLTSTLHIPKGVAVTLEAERPVSLYGPRDDTTIWVFGRLDVNNILIKHGDLVNDKSVGIWVANGADLRFHAGSISRDSREAIPDGTVPTAGALKVVGGRAVFYGGEITDNAAAEAPAIYAQPYSGQGGQVTISNCASISNNVLYGPADGNRTDARGVITISGASLIMNGGRIDHNVFRKLSDQPVEASTIRLLNAQAEISGVIADNTMTDGGGIRMSQSTLTLSDAQILRNTAQNGGGLHAIVRSAVVIDGGRISGNTATGADGQRGNGGGLAMEGGSSLTILRGSIDSNTAGFLGGGVYLSDHCEFTQTGGTIGVGPGAASDVTGNRAPIGAGVSLTDSRFTLSSDGLIAGNQDPNYVTSPTYGGGVYAQDAEFIKIDGGRISNNSAHFGGNISTASSPITITGGVIDSGKAVLGGGIYLYKGTGDKVSELTISGAVIGDPNLSDDVSEGGLARQGGAIWASNSSIELKGGARISGNTADGEGADLPALGAGVYIESSSTLTMTGGSISGNTTPGAGGGVYVDADSEFTQNAGTIGAGFDAPADAKGNSALKGAGVHLAPKSRYAMSGTALIAGNQDPDYLTSKTEGGGVYADSATSFTMEGGRISNNSANRGGNVYASAAPVTLTGALIDSGRAVDGGGLWVKSETELTLTDTVVGDPDPSDAEALGCSATDGGGIWAASSTVNLKGATKISGNTASRGNIGNGGGVFMKDGTLSMSDHVSISHNTARISGGGIWGNGYGGTPYLNLAGSGAIDHNISHMVGGGIAMGDGTLDLNVAVTNNTADWWGGGLDLLNGATAVVHSAVTDNQAGKRGGGVHVGWNRLSLLTVESSATFSGNQAPTVSNRDPYFDKVYTDNIHATQWSSGATQGYNGLDIGYAEPPTCTVTFLDLDDKVLATQKVHPGVDATPPTLPHRPGMAFTGWSTSFTNVLSDVTTKATYSYIEYAISYDFMDGTPSETANPKRYTVADLPLDLPGAPVKAGQTFVGWLNPTDMTVVTMIPVSQTGDLRLAAVWRSATPTPAPMPSATVSVNPTPSGAMPSIGVSVNPTPSGVMPSVPIAVNPAPSGVLPSLPVSVNPTPSGIMPSVPVTLNPSPSGVMPRPTPSPSGIMPSVEVSMTTRPSGVLPSIPVSINPTPTGGMPSIPATINPTPTGGMPSIPIVVNPTPSGVLPSVGVSIDPSPSGVLPSVAVSVNPTPSALLPSIGVSINPTPSGVMPRPTPSPSGTMPSIDVSMNPTP
ncbi:MAG: InlB B-repeat-containing protein, partial [Propionibacteriaceae bacterium]|nr:InlB B-repeat-containing protein [Propionibacteriaceae bacterium]